MKSEEMLSEGGIGGISSLGMVGRDMSMRERKRIWDKGNGSFKRIKDQIEEEKGGGSE